jgi:anti-anti-sigma factor
MSLQYELSTADDVAQMLLSGSIDRDAANTLDQAYRAAADTGATRVELDFSAVQYINSTGIALIVGLLGRARADSRSMLAVGLTQHYRHIFEITRLSDFITIVDPAQSRSAP